MSRASSRGAVAVGAALVALLAAVALSAGLADVVRTELRIAAARRTAATALAAADACCADVAAALGAGWDFDALLAGPDAIVGTADDGMVPTPPGCQARARPGAPPGLHPWLDVAVTVPGGGRTLRALLGRHARPTPAVLWVRDPVTLGGVAGALALDGRDPSRPEAPALPALSAAVDPAVLDAWLSATPAVVLAPQTRPPAYAPTPPLAAFGTRVRAAGAAAVFAPASVPPAPDLHAVAGDLVVDVPGFGAGVLVVDGRLDIRADFSFSGLVAAAGGLRVASTATLGVDGALWLGGDPELDVAGLATVRYALTALEAADALVTFPRRAIVAGLEDG